MGGRCSGAISAPSIINVAAATASMIVVLSITLPVLAVFRGGSRVTDSLENLSVLGAAHALYAFDWNGRQPTLLPDDIALYGNTPAQACANYARKNGQPPPSMIAGAGENGIMWGWWVNFNHDQYRFFQPIDFDLAFGAFRLPNSRGLHEYVDGRFHGPTYYAPQDDLVMSLVEPEFESPYEFAPVDLPAVNYVLTSYVHSPAAQFNAAVMRANAAGGYQNPWSLDDGFTSSGLDSAFYPDLKTHMLEHSWLQNAPADPCNPAFEEGYYGCEPYQFNHAAASAPATLFYDGHVRLLPNSEVMAADDQVLEQTGGVDGLWHRATPFGEFGYLGDVSFDGTNLSHHVLTTDGIQGRDTLADMPASAFEPRRKRPKRRVLDVVRRRLPLDIDMQEDSR